MEAANGLYKIGKSCHPELRLGQLQSASPVEIKLVFAVRTPHAAWLEGYLHQNHVPQRERGKEWFRLDPGHLDAIRALTTEKVEALWRQAEPRPGRQRKAPPVDPTFARRLAELLAASEFNASSLAERAGISKQAMSKLLRGESAPTLETAARIAQALGASVADFVEPPSPYQE